LDHEPTQAEQDQTMPSSPTGPQARNSGDVKPISDGKQRRHSLRVLLVDDNSASQQAMRRIIINAGMLCDVAGNGKEAGFPPVHPSTRPIVCLAVFQPFLSLKPLTRPTLSRQKCSREVGKWMSVSPYTEALAAIENATYHIVLMDFMMPEMDGATATRFLREMEAQKGLRRLPVIGRMVQIDSRLTPDWPRLASAREADT
jgi:CheY-like chemotaxis protein